MSGKTGKEIILDTLRHEPFDRPAWVVYTGVHGGSLLGYSAEEIFKNADKLLASLLEAHRIYTPDGMPALFDLQLEAEILGCHLSWNKDAPPIIKSHPLDIKKNDFRSLPKAGDGRIPIVLNVINRLKSHIGDYTALYGLVTGPLTLSFHLRGMKLFMDIYEDQNYVNKLLNYCTEINLRMAEYYINVGVDVIGIVDPLVSLISPDIFTTFLSHKYAEIFDHIRANKTFSSFFVYGNAIPFIREMAKTRPDCISVDEKTDIVKAKDVTKGSNIVLSGNIPLEYLFKASGEGKSVEFVKHLIRSMGNKNFILSPGYDLPYEVPSANILAISKVMKNKLFF